MKVSRKTFDRFGVEVFINASTSHVNMPSKFSIEGPSSLKWAQFQHSVQIGAFSYTVSGLIFACTIGRYCSFGEEVQIGRQNHPMTWVSTSPVFYLREGGTFPTKPEFENHESFTGAAFEASAPSTQVRFTEIGHDVWIGHGAGIMAGVKIGTGAVIAAHSVVAKDVPPYAVVAGNPAVIKKFRVPPQLVSPLLNSRWWEYAPWQMTHLDPANIAKFVHGINEMRRDGVETYTPEPLSDATPMS